MSRFYAVRETAVGDRYAVMALSDQVRPGPIRAYRWVPNLAVWVSDPGLLADFRAGEADRANMFEEIDDPDTLATLGPLEARLVPRGEGFEAQVRRVLTGGAIVEVARRIAEAAHRGQVDKSGAAYIGHPRRVAARLEDAGASGAVVAAGWLHDVLEDTDTSPSDLRDAGVPLETIEAVQAVTKRLGESMEDYAARIVAVPIAAEVKRADLADNADPIRLAMLDDATRMRLEKKYARMRSLLDAHGSSASK